MCIEGIARALRVFLGKDRPPVYKLVLPSGGEESLVTATISEEVGVLTPRSSYSNLCAQTKQIRPYFACAILRNVKFTERSYESFIDLQDKLHQNICRRRQFVAIGTHDLDTLKAPFTYEALPPKDIKFIPLSKDKAYTAEELMTVYEVYRLLKVRGMKLVTSGCSRKNTLPDTCQSSRTLPYIQ